MFSAGVRNRIVAIDEITVAIDGVLKETVARNAVTSYNK